MGARPEGVRSLTCSAGSPVGLVTGEVVVDIVRCFLVVEGRAAVVEVGERRCLLSVTSVRTGVLGRSSAAAVVDIVYSLGRGAGKPEYLAGGGNRV